MIRHGTALGRQQRSRILCTAFASLAMSLAAAEMAQAYNHEQHQGIVVLGYKAMVAAALERGCASPIDFEGSPPASLRTYVPGSCAGDDAICRARWSTFLEDIERGIQALRNVNTALPRPFSSCPDPGSGGQLGQVRLAVDRYYEREAGRKAGYCGIPPDSTPDCSAPLGLCDPESIYRFLAPTDHTADVLGYWATEPDDDRSVTTLGVKPTNAGGLGQTIDTINDVLETGVFALFAPAVCVFNILRTGKLDCLDEARRLADASVPIEELHSAMPVVGAFRDTDLLTGLWHFQQLVPGASNECDDRQGLFYEQAGPGLVPDAVDIGIMALFGVGATVHYNKSRGPERYNITDPGDGDQPSCNRGRAEWEFQTVGHTTFSPLDNLALHGWKRFAESEFLSDRDLGEPLHAIGDAVAPHHVVGTTGWGHRPFEDAAEFNWRRIILQTTSTGDQKRRLQYEQLRRILIHAFYYYQALDRLRSERPAVAKHNLIPIRAFITEIGSDTLAQTTNPITGEPAWPFDPTVSLAYLLDQKLLGNDPDGAGLYGDEASIQGTRALLERGAGAAAAFLSSIWLVPAPMPLPGDARCDAEQPMEGFFRCGAETDCVGGCCVPQQPDPCTSPCQTDDDCPNLGICLENGCCQGGVK